MAALARASHPALYDRGWHPTAVCGGVGAAVAATALLGGSRDDAVALALTRAGGLRAAFGSDGKSLQVGLAAASGVDAARLAAAGARMPLDRAAAGFEQATGGRYAEPDGGATPARARGRGQLDQGVAVLPADARGDRGRRPARPARRPSALVVTVHPVSLQAAAEGPEPADGLQAKFSIPYLTAYTLLHGPPTVESFDGGGRRGRASGRGRSRCATDAALLESEFVLSGAGGEELRAGRGRARVAASSRWTQRRCARRWSGSARRGARRPRSTTRSARRPSCSRWPACPPPLWPSRRCVRSEDRARPGLRRRGGRPVRAGPGERSPGTGLRDDGFAGHGAARGPRRGRARPRRGPRRAAAECREGRVLQETASARRLVPAIAGRHTRARSSGPSAPATTPAPTTSSAASTAAGRSRSPYVITLRRGSGGVTYRIDSRRPAVERQR